MLNKLICSEMDIFLLHYRINKLIIEIKAVPEINDYHFFQLLNYLRLTEMKLGMILNFHSMLFKNGVKP